VRKRLRGPLVGGEPQGERRKISFADFIIPLGAQKTFRRNRRGKGLALTVHAGNEKKIHGDFMFRAWGRKRVPGGGSTGKEKEEERKRVPSYFCAGSFLFLSYVLPASQIGPKFWIETFSNMQFLWVSTSSHIPRTRQVGPV